jgi:hypothetical protein
MLSSGDSRPFEAQKQGTKHKLTSATEDKEEELTGTKKAKMEAKTTISSASSSTSSSSTATSTCVAKSDVCSRSAMLEVQCAGTLILVLFAHAVVYMLCLLVPV